jgi:large subunit ribosomal protein L23
MAEILIKPVITEKMTEQAEKLNTYGFFVDRNANKIQIKDAVETMYGVTVKSVRTVRAAGKHGWQRTAFGISKGTRGRAKKAYVTLDDGEVIDFYSNIL